jgi:hypothetical protein
MKKYGLKSIIWSYVVIVAFSAFLLYLEYPENMYTSIGVGCFFILIINPLHSNVISLNSNSITFWYLLPFRKTRRIPFEEIEQVEIRVFISKSSSEHIKLFLKNGALYTLETKGAILDLRKLKKDLQNLNIPVKSYNLRDINMWDRDYYIDEDPD